MIEQQQRLQLLLLRKYEFTFIGFFSYPMKIGGNQKSETSCGKDIAQAQEAKSYCCCIANVKP
jgi:hypothetical protein